MGCPFLCLFNIPLFKSQLPTFYLKTFFMLICDIVVMSWWAVFKTLLRRVAICLLKNSNQTFNLGATNRCENKALLIITRPCKCEILWWALSFGDDQETSRLLWMGLQVTLFPFLSCRFQPDTASQTDMRAQEPDMRFRHRLHHQRHAYCGQSSAAERHEIGEAPSTAIPRLLYEQWPGRQNNNKIFEKTIALLSNRHTRLQGNGGHQGCDTCREGSILMALWLKYISLFAIRHLVFIRWVIVALSLVAAIERKCSDSPVLCCSVYHTV